MAKSKGTAVFVRNDDGKLEQVAVFKYPADAKQFTAEHRRYGIEHEVRSLDEPEPKPEAKPEEADEAPKAKASKADKTPDAGSGDK